MLECAVHRGYIALFYITRPPVGAEAAGPFYEHSVAAARRLGRRAVLIVGKNSRHRLALLPDGVIACDYAPFSELFPRAAVIVHAGGIGTTGLAMRSGRPMLVVPYAHDQFDNAARATRLGIARTIPQRRYLPSHVAAELGSLLNNPLYARRASSLGERMVREDGVRLACDALEGLLGASRPAETAGGDQRPGRNTSCTERCTWPAASWPFIFQHLTRGPGR